MTVALPTTHFLREVPSQVAKTCDRQAKLWNLAAKVATAALFAISATVLGCLVYAAVTGIAFSGPASWGLFGLIASTFVLSPLAPYCAQRAEDKQKKAQIEYGVDRHLNAIAGWKKEELAAFCEAEKIPLAGSLPLEERRPLIARLQYWKETVAREADDAARHINPDHPHTYLKTENLDLRFAERVVGCSKMENTVYPSLLQSAAAFELISNPHQELALGQLGSCFPRSLGRRLVAALMDRNIPDPYFQFSNPTRKPLTAYDLEQGLTDLAGLHQKMFAVSE